MNVVLDVGANRGLYGQELRAHGYKERIESFEPLEEPYRRLCYLADSFTGWRCHQLALSNLNGESLMNVAGNSESSSLHAMLDSHRNAAPDSAYVGTEKVETAKLDLIRSRCMHATDVGWLKLDVQGHEEKVLEGARESMSQIAGIEIELSLLALYEGQVTICEMIQLLDDFGYHLAWLQGGWSDRMTLRLMQADGIFLREDPRPDRS